MTALSTSYDVKSYDVTTLAAGITATQTAGIKLNVVSVNGADSAWATTTGGVIEVKQETVDGVKVEYIAYGGGTVNADNTFTLSDVSRDVSRSGTSFTGSGTGQRFNKGASVRLVNFHLNFNKKANIDRDSGFTVKQSFNKGVRHVPFADATARDAYFTAPVSGDECFVTGVGKQVYNGGWVTTNASTNSVATTTTAGTVEVGTAADNAASTDAGDSGAKVVVPTSLLVKTSSGAGDENKIPVLDSSGKLATGFISLVSTFVPTVKSANYTAAAGDLVVCSPTSTAYTITLPASPSAGDVTGLVLDSGFNVAYDAVSHGSASSANSLTFSHTCTGTNRALFVAVWTNVNNTDKVTGVTYNGVAMTRVSTATVSTTRAYLYALANPASGANNVVISASDSLSDIYASSASYTGVNQTTPYNAADTNTTAGATSLGVAVTTTIDQSWVLIMGGLAATVTSITNGTIRYANSPPIGDTGGVVTPAGAKTLTLNWTGSGAAEAISCAIVPTSAITLDPNGKSINGSSANRTFSVDGDCYLVQYNGTQWNVVGYVHNAP